MQQTPLNFEKNGTNVKMHESSACPPPKKRLVKFVCVAVRCNTCSGVQLGCFERQRRHQRRAVLQLDSTCNRHCKSRQKNTNDRQTRHDARPFPSAIQSQFKATVMGLRFLQYISKCSHKR